MKDHYNFSKNLKEIMTTLGIKQIELSKETGLTQAAISQLLSGIRDPSIHTIVKIMKFIPVNFNKLITIAKKEK